MNHLSHTQANMFMRCQKQYYYRYLEGLVIPTGAMLLLGKSYHKAHEVNFGQKIESKKDLPATEVKEAFATDFEERKNEEEIDWKDEKPGDLKDTGVNLTGAYHDKVSPLVNPTHVELPFEIEFDNADYQFIGRVDVVTSERIIDLKTAKRKPPEADIHKDLQATAYMLANRYAINDGIERSFRYDYAIKTKTPSLHSIETVRTDEDINWYLMWIGKLAQAIKQATDSGVFIENTNGWHCSPDWCGFFEKCQPYKQRVISI